MRVLGGQEVLVNYDGWDASHREFDKIILSKCRGNKAGLQHKIKLKYN